MKVNQIKTLRNIEKSYIISTILLLPLIMTLFTGLILVFGFHQSHNINKIIWSMDKNTWVDIHIYSSIISTVILIYHLYYIRKRLKLIILFSKQKSKPQKASAYLFWFFMICFLSGLIRTY